MGRFNTNRAQSRHKPVNKIGKTRGAGPCWGIPVRLLLGSAIGLALLAAAAASGQIITPLYVGNLQPVLDQNGNPMPGMYYDDPSDRSRVEIRSAVNGIIFPPNTNGAPHPNNPLLTPDSVGGVGMNSGSPGLFAMVFPQRPAVNTRIFARVFNAPAVADASFYADSRVATVTASAVSLVVYFLDETKPLDRGDSDGDGLINSWEKALGTDGRPTPDFDEDGMSDHHEMLAGTDPTDAASYLAIRAIAQAAGTSVASGDGAEAMRVRFLSQPGRKYQLEQTALLPGEQLFEAIGEILTAGDGQYELDAFAPVDPEAGATFYRIRLVP